MKRSPGIPGFSAPAAGFDAPLEMLSDCHGRIAAQCATLRRLGVHVATAGSDDDAIVAAHNVIRYFDGSGQHHHNDEEQDLFPALLESVAGSDATCIRELIDTLLAEHRELDRGWRTMRAWLARVEAGENVAPPPGEIDRFIERYERHIAREEADLLPMAARQLGPDVLERIGGAMSRRRGVRVNPARDA